MKKLDIASLKTSIAKGNIKTALGEMLLAAQVDSFPFSMEIYVIRNRYESLEKDKWRRTISHEDYQIENNQITHSLLEILNALEQDEAAAPKDNQSCLEQFILEYEYSDRIKSRASSLRTKNHVSRKIGDLLIKSPNLFDVAQAKNNKALICGFCFKVKSLPAFGDLDVLAHLANADLGNFSKGSIVNALAELVYHGKLGLGEDKVLSSVLETLSLNADFALQKNIERVQAALNYLLDQNTILNNTSNKLITAETYQYDGNIYNVLLELNRLATSEEGLSATNFIESIAVLFQRMTFCGEPDIATCRSQNWTKRVHSALMTHQVLLQLQPTFQSLANKKQQQDYQSLLLSISQYIDSMIAYLFEEKSVKEAEIKHLIGQADFVSHFKQNKAKVFESIQIQAEGEPIAILNMPDAERKEINKYLAQSIEKMDELSKNHKK